MSTCSNTRPSRRSRDGVTLVELLVVIAVIGILAGLLFPAVQYARGAARRTMCRNRLRQISLALHSYHDRSGSFPALSVVDRSGPEPIGWWSWRVQILPELEERSLYDNIDLREDVWANADKYKPCTSQQLAVFMCPSDVQVKRIYESNEFFPAGEAYALTSYFGCRGSSDAVPGDGVFPAINQTVRFGGILDGTSQTILVGERPADTNAVWGWWAAGKGFDDEGLGDHVLDASEGFYTGNRSDTSSDLTHFWSAHPDGAHFAMCDGSLHRIAYTIDDRVFRALASRSGGERTDDQRL